MSWSVTPVKGIPADALPKLFDPFFRVHHQGGARRRGLGLGLAIVKIWWICMAGHHGAQYGGRRH